MDRHCKKCGDIIPYNVWIDGRMASLTNRIFCLKCSPYKSHNTRSDDPAISSELVNKYKTWPKERRMIHTVRNIVRGTEAREKLIELAGGKCIKCGYCKCQRSMNFHHRDPSTKKFSLAVTIICRMEWDKVLEEIEKCDLLCANCHGEEEHKLNKERLLNDYPELKNRTFNKWSDMLREIGKSTKKSIMTIKKVCPICGKEFNTKCQKIFCSNRCRGKFCQSPTKPSKEELEVMVRNKVPWEKLGRTLNVTGNAVKKWARQYGIEFDARRKWNTR